MLNKLKKISLRDILGIFKFLLVLIPSIIYGTYLRLFKKHMWLICEREDMARDNGLAFFEYMQKEHPELKTYYAIDKKNPDYKYAKKFEPNIVKWASLKHYFLYMSATRNISSHKEGNPNQTLFTILHLYLNLYNNRVFLQHGILKDDAPMFYYKNTKFKLFICGAKPEYDYISKHYGYPEGRVVYTGLARYDKLSNDETDNSIIVYIPTWRRWLNKSNIEKSDYKKNILSFVNDSKLEDNLKRSNKTMYFYPHARVQDYFSADKITNSQVKLLKQNDISLNRLIRQAGALITDYSSLFFDFAYLKKPIIYYQPDYTYFRAHHELKEGYFSYEDDGFGPVVKSKEELIAQVAKTTKNMAPGEEYLKRAARFFIYTDHDNCKRIYEEIRKI